MIKDPSAVPTEGGLVVEKGTSAYLRLWGDKVLPTARLIRISPEKRHCLYPHEALILGRGYLRLNCQFDCYDRFMYHDCGCVPGFLRFAYATGKRPGARVRADEAPRALDRGPIRPDVRAEPLPYAISEKVTASRGEHATDDNRNAGLFRKKRVKHNFQKLKKYYSIRIYLCRTVTSVFRIYLYYPLQVQYSL